MLGQKLFVDIVQATGLQHMNHFTGDHPYVQCEVKHLNRHEQTTKAATKPVTVGDTLNPVWNERLEIQPWQPGEDLEFTVYDKGLIGARTEGKVMLSSAQFYPSGFNGWLPISGMQHAMVQVSVQPAGGATSTYGGATSAYGAATSAYGGATSAYGGATSAYGGATSAYGGATSAYGVSTGTAYTSAAAVPAMTTAAQMPATTYYSAETPMMAAAPMTYSTGTPAAAPMTYSAETPMMAAAPMTYSTGTPAAAPMTYSAGTPMTTMMAPSTSYTQSNAMPMTYSAAAPTTAYSASTPMITAPTTAYSASTPMMTAPTTYSASTPMISAPTTYSASTPAMPVQTQAYAAPMQTYASPPSPTQNYATPMQTYVSPPSPTQNYATPMQTYASPPSPTYVQQPQTPQTYAVQGGQTYGAGGTYGTGAYKLAVSIVQAQGLKHLNNFTGDHPYVVCEVKHTAHRERRTKVETKPVTVGDTLNPVWNDTQELEPWHQGEPLEFSVYDKGLLGSKTEGKATLPAEWFFNNPNGFYGSLPISGLPHALLVVGVRLLGPSAITVEANSGLFAPTTTTEQPAVTQVMSQEGFVTQTVVSKKRSKKIKVGSKKKSGCC